MIVLVVYYDIYPIIMLLYLKIFGGGKLKLGGGNPSAPPPLYATLHKQTTYRQVYASTFTLAGLYSRTSIVIKDMHLGTNYNQLIAFYNVACYGQSSNSS